MIARVLAMILMWGGVCPPIYACKVRNIWDLGKPLEMPSMPPARQPVDLLRSAAERLPQFASLFKEASQDIDASGWTVVWADQFELDVMSTRLEVSGTKAATERDQYVFFADMVNVAIFSKQLSKDVGERLPNETEPQYVYRVEKAIGTAHTKGYWRQMEVLREMVEKGLMRRDEIPPLLEAMYVLVNESSAPESQRFNQLVLNVGTLPWQGSETRLHDVWHRDAVKAWRTTEKSSF